MPYASEKQRKFFNANRAKLERQGVDVDEWNASTKGKDPPEKAPMKKSASAVLYNVLLLNNEKRAAQMYAPGDAERAARLADEKALREAQRIPEQRARERARAQTETQEATLRSEQQHPEFATWQEKRRAYENAQQRRSIPPFSKAEYNGYVKSIDRDQARRNTDFSAAAQSAQKPAPAPVKAPAPAAPPVSAPAASAAPTTPNLTKG